MIFTTNLTGDDLARWRKLVRIAGHCASHPRASAVELGRAAKRVGKARVPGALSRENPAVQLMTAARDYAALDGVGRAAKILVGKLPGQPRERGIIVADTERGFADHRARREGIV